MSVMTRLNSNVASGGAIALALGALGFGAAEYRRTDTLEDRIAELEKDRSALSVRDALVTDHLGDLHKAICDLEASSLSALTEQNIEVSLLNTRLVGIERSSDAQKSLITEEISQVAIMVSGFRAELDGLSLDAANSDESFSERIADLHRSIDEFDQTVENRLTSSNKAIGSIEKSLQKDYGLLLHNLMAPTVQVSGNETVGTGVIIGSNGTAHSNGTQYILTAWHVIRDLFYDSENPSPEIEVQAYNTGKTKVTHAHSAVLVEHDADIDIALLRLSDLSSPLVGAKLPDFTTSEAGRVFQSVYAVGCPLGNDPVPTLGEILDIDHQVDGVKYWMISAPTYIGNSGGGVFDKETHELLGIFTKIYTHGTVRPSVVPHMGLMTPMDQVYKWMDRVGYASLIPNFESEPGPNGSLAGNGADPRPISASAKMPR